MRFSRHHHPVILRLFLLLAVVFVSASIPGCRSVSTGDDGASEERRRLVGELGRNVIVPTCEKFVSRAEALSAATSEWADALRSGEGDTTGENGSVIPEAVRDAWREAMVAWQRAEVMQVGPAAPRGLRTRGRGVRDEIYSWPTVNSCRVDQHILKGDYARANFFNTQLVNAYGLDALEYLLFNDSTGNTCQQRTLDQDAWKAMDGKELWQRRADYAAATSAHLVETARALLEGWTDEEDGFLKHVENAGLSGSEFATAAEALDEVFAGMFYVDLVVKDVKLAIPVGIDRSCVDVCPDRVESRWARHSGENIRANLEGLQLLFHGGDPEGDGYGFDDLLVEMNAGELAEAMESVIAESIASLTRLGSFEDALENDPDAVRAVHTAVKDVTDELKTRFVTVLNLKVPQEGAADND